MVETMYRIYFSSWVWWGRVRFQFQEHESALISLNLCFRLLFFVLRKDKDEAKENVSQKRALIKSYTDRRLNLGLIDRHMKFYLITVFYCPSIAGVLYPFKISLLIKKEKVWKEKILPHIAEVYLHNLRVRGCLFYPPLTTILEADEFFMANNILLIYFVVC